MDDALGPRPDWWLNVSFPNRGEYILAVTAWTPDDAILVTNQAVYRATLNGGRENLTWIQQR